jgi:hypothetical protein
VYTHVNVDGHVTLTPCDIAADGGTEYIRNILLYTLVAKLNNIKVCFAGPLLILVQKIKGFVNHWEGKLGKLTINLLEIDLCLTLLLDLEALTKQLISKELCMLYLLEERISNFYNHLDCNKRVQYSHDCPLALSSLCLRAGLSHWARCKCQCLVTCCSLCLPLRC